MAQRPTAIGLHVCEQVIYEAESNNITLVNSFRRRFVDQAPVDPFPFTVFALLTDGQDDLVLDLVIEHLEDLEEVYRRSLRLRFASPLQEARCRFRVRDCGFPAEGGYQITLLIDGEPIAQCRLMILLREEES